MGVNVCKNDIPVESYIGVTPLISVNKANVIIEVVKHAENGEGYIVRLYECNNSYENVCCMLAPEVVGAEVCNMLEESKDVLDIQEHAVNIVMKPYEIKTIRLRVK